MTISEIFPRVRSFSILACTAAILAAAACAGPTAAGESHVRHPVRIGEIVAGSPLWSEWSRRYLRPSGRVVDTAGRGVSHSEGQGYGMLLAVAAGDRPAFDRIWGWTRANLGVRLDNLLAWRWDPAARAVSDRNNATDGDILIAWALAEAADLWDAQAYAEAGGEIAAAIARHLVVDAVGVGPVLLPAHFGFARSEQADGPVVNLSYWIFPAFSRLAQLAPGHDWDRLRQSGLAVLDAIQSQASAGVTNWTALGDSTIAPARRFPAKIGYDAVRIPLYLAFAPRDNVERLARFDRMFPAGARGVPIVDARTGETDEMAAGRGYRAIAALRACAVGRQPFPREFYWLGEDEPYYPATLHALALIAALMSHSPCLDPVEAGRLQPFGWSRRLAGDLARFRAARPVAFQPPQAGRPAVPAAAPARDDEDATAGKLLRAGAPLGALLALIGFIVMSRRSDAPALAAEPTPPALRERTPAPRQLPDNPFRAAHGERALEQRLDLAARASREWRRTAAVACFRLSDYGDIVVADGIVAAERTMTAMVAALSTRVRKSDSVTLLAPNEIVVCLSLIADEIDLASVGRRLTAALREIRPLPDADENLFGLALYETESTGASCLAQARGAFDAIRGPRPRSKAVAKKSARRKAPARTGA